MIRNRIELCFYRLRFGRDLTERKRRGEYFDEDRVHVGTNNSLGRRIGTLGLIRMRQSGCF